MSHALFLNGVYEDVLEEILLAQNINPDITSFIQPYSGGAIRMLADDLPTEISSVKFYISITTSLNLVSYTAQITGWDDKRDLINDNNKLQEINDHIKKYQPKAEEAYMFSDKEEKKPCVNLIKIKNLKKIENPFLVKNLIKVSNNKSHLPRTQAGGWSEVYKVSDLIDVVEISFKTNFDQELANSYDKAIIRTSEQRKKRIEEAPKRPEQIQLISRGFKRNSDVVAEVLYRANGICERCHSDAPFVRRKDNTPYLEVHHKVTLADDGDDTVENAIAVCPNCHRELHFGI